MLPSFQKMQTYANYIPLSSFILFLKRLCSTRSEFFKKNLPQQQPQPAVSFNCRQVIHRFFCKKTKPGLVQGMHESQGKNDHQHHHDQGIDLPRWWGRLSLVGVYRAQGNPMRQTHSIAAKNPGNVSYVSCKLYVLVSLEGANFKESIIIYYPYLAIPKP